MRDFGASPVSGGFDTNLNVGRVAGVSSHIVSQ